MNQGKTLFAQLMDFLPWTTFARCVARYDGDKGVRRLSCAEQFCVMAFAQLTYCAYRPMTDTIPERWRTVFRRQGGHRSGTMADSF